MQGKISKVSTILTNPHYNTPGTSLLMLKFDPHLFEDVWDQLGSSSIQHASLSGKDIYLIDHLFQEEEREELRGHSQKSSFSRNSYGSLQGKEKGEKPARTMNTKERWGLFTHPPKALSKLYKLLNTLSYKLNADITTLPWELCDLQGLGSPAVIINFLDGASLESMDFGKHKDSNPEQGLAFGVPNLYEERLHDSAFVNGSKGKPWVISAMLYSTSSDFLPEYRLGTAFYQDDHLALKASCLDTRLVLFEGDIVHTIEASNFPLDSSPWRVSYVFKLILNPRKQEACVKREFSTLMQSISSYKMLSSLNKTIA